MSFGLGILVAIVAAVIIIFSIIRVSMWITDRKEASGNHPWGESGYGNYDGYDCGSDFGGGDCGGSD